MKSAMDRRKGDGCHTGENPFVAIVSSQHFQAYQKYQEELNGMLFFLIDLNNFESIEILYKSMRYNNSMNLKIIKNDIPIICIQRTLSFEYCCYVFIQPQEFINKWKLFTQCLHL
jgi:hypothetical protein